MRLPGRRIVADDERTPSSGIMLGFHGIIIISTLTMFQSSILGASVPNSPELSLSSPENSIDSLMITDLHLNSSTSTAVRDWSIQCGQDTIPPGWEAPPSKRKIASPIQCRGAILQMTRQGDSQEPQVWTSQAEWSYHSCGVILEPGWSYARVSFSRRELAEIAKAIRLKCVNQENDFMGGWVSIGGLFVLLLTGTGLADGQPSNLVSRSA